MVKMGNKLVLDLELVAEMAKACKNLWQGFLPATTGLPGTSLHATSIFFHSRIMSLLQKLHAMLKGALSDV